MHNGSTYIFNKIIKR